MLGTKMREIGKSHQPDLQNAGLLRIQLSSGRNASLWTVEELLESLPHGFPKRPFGENSVFAAVLRLSVRLQVHEIPIEHCNGSPCPKRLLCDQSGQGCLL